MSAPVDIPEALAALSATRPQFDHETVEMLWEAQCMCRAIRLATPLDEENPEFTPGHRHFALQGLERQIDAIIRRGGMNSGIGFE